MKILFCIFLLLPAFISAQTKNDNFYKIDNGIMSIPFARADTLAKQLAALGHSDREKVRAIFRWITEHIDYNTIFFNRRKPGGPLFYEEPDDSNAALPPLNERVAAKVLYKKVAFCDGYARLFKTLCDHAGIKSEIIVGYARTNMSKKFAVNHTWNAVCIDSAWHLLDATWASGFISYSGQYIKEYNDFYFLTPPEQFIRDHYPEDLQWTLLTNPPVYREFLQAPFRYPGFLKAGLTNHFPARGVIEAAIGDTVMFEVKSRWGLSNFYVSSSSVFDTTQLAIKPVLNDEKFSIKYAVTSDTGEWLYVFCNEELALRYRLNVKKPGIALLPPGSDK